ncbi:MAG: HAD family hydrolase [Actinomycetes bacterium]
MPITTDVSSVRAVLLDIDDTLVDTRGAFRHALAVVGERHLPGPVDADALVATWRADVNGWYRAFARGELGYREQRMRRANELHALYGGPVMDDAAYDAWDAEFEAAFREGWVAHVDAVPLLDALDLAGVAYGAVSNAHVAYQRDKLDRAGLERVPMLVGVDTFGVGKPDPRVFLEGARLLGAEPASAAYVGDELDIDARAAVAAGLACGVWVDRPQTRRDGHAGGGDASSLGDGVVRVERLADVAAALGL